MNAHQKLYSFATTLFSVLVIVTNLITIKLFTFFGISLPAGSLTFPLIFLLTDLTTEVFGKEKARHMISTGFVMSLFSHLIFQLALVLPSDNEPTNISFQQVYSLNGPILFGSLLAFVISQNIDISLYQFIKNRTGDRALWLRTNGSTLVSQVIDTLIVNVCQFSIGLGLPFSKVFPIILFDYGFKALFSLVSTPLLYIALHFVKIYLNKEKPIHV